MFALKNAIELKIVINLKELSKLRTALTGSDNGRLNDLSKMKG